MIPGLDRLRTRLPDALRERAPEGSELARWLEALGPDLGEALALLDRDELEAAVEELVAIGEPAGPALRRAEERCGDKTDRKLLRRGLHALKSRGVDVPEPPRTEGRSVLRPLEEAREQAFASAPDGRGARLMIFVTPAHRRTLVTELLVSDREGVVRLDRLAGRRSDARRLVRDLLDPDKGRAAEVDPSAARAYLRRVERDRADSPRPGVDPAMVVEMSRGPEAETPGQALRARLASAAMPDAEAESLLRARVEAGLVAPWIPAEERMEAIGERLHEIEASPLVLSEAQKRARSSECLEEAAAELLPPEMRERLASRLEEAGVVLDAQGDEAGATAAVRVASRVREAERPLDVPFLRTSLELSLEFVRRKREEADAGKLIVPPGGRR